MARRILAIVLILGALAVQADPCENAYDRAYTHLVSLAPSGTRNALGSYLNPGWEVFFEEVIRLELSDTPVNTVSMIDDLAATRTSPGVMSALRDIRMAVFLLRTMINPSSTIEQVGGALSMFAFEEDYIHFRTAHPFDRFTARVLALVADPADPIGASFANVVLPSPVEILAAVKNYLEGMGYPDTTNGLHLANVRRNLQSFAVLLNRYHLQRLATPEGRVETLDAAEYTNLLAKLDTYTTHLRATFEEVTGLPHTRPYPYRVVMEITASLQQYLREYLHPHTQAVFGYGRGQVIVDGESAHFIGKGSFWNGLANFPWAAQDPWRQPFLAGATYSDFDISFSDLLLGQIGFSAEDLAEPAPSPELTRHQAALFAADPSRFPLLQKIFRFEQRLARRVGLPAPDYGDMDLLNFFLTPQRPRPPLRTFPEQEIDDFLNFNFYQRFARISPIMVRAFSDGLMIEIYDGVTEATTARYFIPNRVLRGPARLPTNSALVN